MCSSNLGLARWKSFLKKLKSERGFLLLEVLLALSVITVGTAAATRVFGQILQVQKASEKQQRMQVLAEEIFFEAVTTESFFLKDSASEKEGEISAGEKGENYHYQIGAAPFKNSKQDYNVSLVIEEPGSGETHSFKALLRHEA